MKLITPAIEKQLEKYPLYSQDSKGEDAEIVCKFFTPNLGWTWYVLEGERQEDGDFCFFGIVSNNGDREYGYFSLNELQQTRLPFGMRIERDIIFLPTTVAVLNQKSHL